MRYFIWVTSESGSSTSGSSTVAVSQVEMSLCTVQIIFKIVAAVLRIPESMTDLIKVAVLPEEKASKRHFGTTTTEYD